MLLYMRQRRIRVYQFKLRGVCVCEHVIYVDKTRAEPARRFYTKSRSHAPHHAHAIRIITITINHKSIPSSASVFGILESSHPHRIQRAS